MPMKKSKKGSSLKRVEPKKTSPFSSAFVDIELDSATLHVHEALIESAAPKLFTAFQRVRSIYSSVPTTVDLKDVSLDVGHVLLKWIYTGTYQLPEGEDSEEETAGPSPTPYAETLSIAFGVYSLSRKYELPGLEVLAREQISLLGSATDVFTFIDVIEKVYPRTVGKSDAWLGEYIATRMKSALKDDHEKNLGPRVAHEQETIEKELGEEEYNTPISKLLVKGMLQAYREIVRVPHPLKDLVPPEAAVEAVPGMIHIAVEPSTIEPAEKGRASPGSDDWVFPSPKGKEKIAEEKPAPEPEPQPEPPLEPEPEPEPVTITEAVNGNDEWAAFPALSKKGKKGKKGNKTKETRVIEAKPNPVAEIPQEVEPPPESIDELRDAWEFWGAKRSPRQSFS